MKLPLRIVKNNMFSVPIADADNRIICQVVAHRDAFDNAEAIVKAMNRPRWWHRFRINKPYTRSDWEWKRPWWATKEYFDVKN
jgi:hypothetical protein